MTHENSQLSSKQIKWDDFLEVSEQDDFEFRLLDDGLGFHQKEEIEKKTSTIRSVRPAKKVPEVPNFSGNISGRTIRTKTVKTAKLRSGIGSLPEVSMPIPEVSTGYPHQEEIVNPKKVTKKVTKQATHAERSNEKTHAKVKKRFKLASVEARLGAYVLDLFFLAIMNVTLVLVGAFTLGVTVDRFVEILTLPNYTLLVVSLILLMDLFYFALLDCDQSFGKKIMQIKVINKVNGHSARYGQCLTRALLVLTLLPVLFSLQDSMSDTEVVKCN